MASSERRVQLSNSISVSSVEVLKHVAISLTESNHEVEVNGKIKSLSNGHKPNGICNDNYDDSARNNRWKCWTKVYLVVINFIAASAYSMPAPILPREAELKKVSSTEFGFIFGIYDFMLCISSPFYSKLVNFVKPRVLLRIGLLSAGTTSIIFGLLDYVPPGKAFVVLAFIVRSLDGLGDSAIMNSVYTICATEFPKNIGATYSLLEASFALGLTIGPLIGGGLYQAGSEFFGLPFFLTGSVKFAILISLTVLTDTGVTVRKYQQNYFQLFKNDGIITGVLCMLLYFLCIGFNSATLEFHLDQFHLNPTVSSLIFTICGCVDSASAPLVGYLSDRSGDPLKYSLLGIVLTIFAFLIIGPVPFLHFTTELWNILLAQVLLGLAMSATVISSMSSCLQLAIKKGYPDDVPTYAWVAAIFFVFSASGVSIGAAMSGVLRHVFGYENACVIIVGILATAVSLLLLLRFRRLCRCQRVWE